MRIKFTKRGDTTCGYNQHDLRVYYKRGNYIEHVVYDENDRMIHKKNNKGYEIIQSFYPDGTYKSIKYDDGAEFKYDENGKVIYHHIPNGQTEDEWFYNRLLKRRKINEKACY